MPFDPISESLWSAIDRRVRDEDEKDRKRGYWILCSSCGRRVVKKEFDKKGCYACGWKEGESGEKVLPYRTECNGCGREVITKELIEKGCFICGWGPADRSQRTEDRGRRRAEKSRA